MLSFNKVIVWIAGVHVLRNVTFELRPGATVALIGRNGAGKTTIARTTMGFTDTSGEVRLADLDLGKVAPHQRPGLGMGPTLGGFLTAECADR